MAVEAVNAVAGDSEVPVEQELAKALDLDAAPVKAEEENEPEETQEVEEKATETEAEGQIEYLNQLADLFEDTTEESLYALRVKSGLHEGKSYTVGELKDFVDRREAFEQQQKEFEEQKAATVKEIEELKTKAQASITQQQSVPEEILNAQAQELAILNAHNSIKWDELEKDDPGQFAALKVKYQQAYQQAQTNTAALRDKFQKEYEDNFKSFQATQWQETVKRIPEWKDQKAFENDHNAMYALAQGYGYTPQDVNAVIDPRMRQLLRDYTKLKQSVDSANAEAKKVTERGNPVLRSNFRPKKKDRIQQTVEQAKRPNATRKDKLAAERELLESVPGFL